VGVTAAAGARWAGYVPVARPASVRVAGTAPSVGEGRVIPTPQDAGYRAGRRPPEVGESTPARNGDRGSAGNVRRHLGGDGQPDACEPRAPVRGRVRRRARGWAPAGWSLAADDERPDRRSRALAAGPDRSRSGPPASHDPALTRARAR